MYAQQSAAPMELNKFTAGFAFPVLSMGEDRQKNHILPGEHLQGKIVNVQHVTFPVKGDEKPKRSTVVSLQVSFAKINTGLLGGTFCIIIGNLSREAFITAQLGINDYFGITYEGRFPTKNNPMYKFHKYDIEGQKTAESQVVGDNEPLQQQQQQQQQQQAPQPGVQQTSGYSAPAHTGVQAPAAPQAPTAPQPPAQGNAPVPPQAPTPPAPPTAPNVPQAPTAPGTMAGVNQQQQQAQAPQMPMPNMPQF